MDATKTTKNAFLAGITIACLAVGACDQATTGSEVGAKQQLGMALPAAILNSSLPEGCPLEAFLQIDVDQPQPMTVVDGVATLTIPSPSPGDHAISILFTCQSEIFGDVVLSTGQKIVDVTQAQSTVSFVEDDYQFPDDDADSYSNLMEVTAGSNPRDRADPVKQWGSAAPLEIDATGDAERVELATNAEGSALAVWQQFNGTVLDIWGSHFDPQTGWDTPVRLELNNGGSARNPMVSIDAEGNGMAIWQQTNAQNRTPIRYSRFDRETGWAPAEVFEIPAGSGAAAGSARIAMNDAGVAFAVWNLRAQTADPGLSIWASRYDPVTGWAIPVVIDQNDVGDARTPRVAVDINGNALAVWREAGFDPGGTVETDGDLWSNLYVADTGWGDAQPVESEAGNSKPDFDVALSDDGTGLTVWVQGTLGRESLFANQFDVATATWGKVALIESPGVGVSPEARRPDVEFDSSGKALAVWQQRDPVFVAIYGNEFDPLSGWDQAELIATGGVNATPMTLSFGSGGEAISVWRQTVDARSDVWAGRFDPMTGWSPGVIAEDIDVGNAINPKIGMDRFGRAVTIWVQVAADRTEIWSSRYQ